MSKLKKGDIIIILVCCPGTKMNNCCIHYKKFPFVKLDANIETNFRVFQKYTLLTPLTKVLYE